MSDHVVVSNEVLGYIALVDEFFTEHGWESALLLQARRGITEALEAAVYLPDAEHIHVHRRADGTITAVPMEERCGWCGRVPNECRGGDSDYTPVWRDVEGGGA